MAAACGGKMKRNNQACEEWNNGNNHWSAIERNES